MKSRKKHMALSLATSSLVNYGGVGTTVNRSVGSVSMIRACYSRPALLMSCGSWSG